MLVCRKCGNENADDAGKCARCGGDLSAPLQTGKTPVGSGGDLVQLATFHTVSEADMVQELLESNGIESMLHGENDPIGAMSGAEPIILMVEKEDLERATELYEAFFAGDEAVNQDGPQAESE